MRDPAARPAAEIEIPELPADALPEIDAARL